MKDPKHFQWRVEGKVGVITLNRPERKNPLTFDSYAELRDFFKGLKDEKNIRSIVITGAGGNFCSGGARGRGRSSPWPRTCATRRRRPRSLSSSCASASPDATWARARCCRGSSARGGRRSFSTPAAR